MITFNKKKFNFIILFILTLSSYAQVSFHRNDSNIVLQINGDTLKNAWAGGFNSAQFSEIDLNLDGIKDLFVFSKTDGRIIPFINKGTANQVSYQHAPEFIQYFPFLHDWVLLRDYNCDGKMDIFTYSTGGMAIYKNTSTSNLSFELQTKLLFSDFRPNLINLYVSSADIPAIDDIDGDGDLDILTFSILGANVEYHKNLSIETYGTCDSLNFQLTNNCWGFFSESNSTNQIHLYDTCKTNVPSPEIISKETEKGNKHSGSTLLTLDADANGSKDLILGDVSFGNLTILYNDDNSSDKTSAIITNQDTAYPKNNLNTTAVDVSIFPAGFYFDVDNDNIKDLIVAPNCFNGCENKNNVWYYKNSNANNNASLDLITTGFLQEGMIEVGEGANPVFFDYNSDGLMDIIIGNYGVYDPSAGSLVYKSSLWLYENIGTINTPSYQLVDTDYANISNMNLDIGISQPTLRLIPTFGDLDNDDDLDMIIGDYKGFLHYFENTAGPGNTANFTLNTPQYSGIDVGNFASPQLIDLNRDALLDLVIGKNNGYISYYQNSGTTSSPAFTFITDSLGGVKTRGVNDFNGYSTPFIFDNAGQYILMAGSFNGSLYIYDDIDGNLNGSFSILDSTFQNIWEGAQSFINIADVTNDNIPDMLLGNISGGVSFYKGDLKIPVFEKNDLVKSIKIFPNPSKNTITINLGDNDLTNSSIQIIDVLGKVVNTKLNNKNVEKFDLSNYPNGIYFIKFTNKLSTITHKIIKE